MFDPVDFATKIHKKLREKVAYWEWKKIKTTLNSWQNLSTKEKIKNSRSKNKAQQHFASLFLNSLNLEQPHFIKRLPPSPFPTLKAKQKAKEINFEKAFLFFPLPENNYFWEETQWLSYNFFLWASKNPEQKKQWEEIPQTLKKFDRNLEVHFHTANYLWKSWIKGAKKTLSLHLAFLLLPKEEMLFCLHNLGKKNKIFNHAALISIFRDLKKPRPNFENSHGFFVNLNSITKKVQATWFAEFSEAENLVQWGESYSNRILGSYHPLHGLINISLIFDSLKLDPALLEYLIFHELLHKFIGFQVYERRLNAHTPLFRKIEMAYPNQKLLEKSLQHYAQGYDNEI